MQWFMESLQDFLVQIDPEKSLRRDPEYGEAYTQNLLEKISVNGILYLAIENNAVLGMIAWIITEQTELEKLWNHEKKIWTIIELIVNSESRWTWIGSALIEALEKYFTDHHCNWLTVECFVPNISAHLFYQKHGYKDRSVYMTKTLF